jgi:hypothetical protein
LVIDLLKAAVGYGLSVLAAAVVAVLRLRGRVGSRIRRLGRVGGGIVVVLVTHFVLSSFLTPTMAEFREENKKNARRKALLALWGGLEALLYLRPLVLGR